MSDTDAKELATVLREHANWLHDHYGVSSVSAEIEQAAVLLLRQSAQIAKLETQIAKAIQELRPSSGIASIGAACAALEKP